MQATLLFQHTSTVPSAPKDGLPGNKTFQATVRGVGAVAATILIEGSNDKEAFLLLGTITLSGTTQASDGFVGNAPWHYVRARLDTAPTGTGAAVTVTVGG